MLNKNLSPKAVLSAAGEFMAVKPGIDHEKDPRDSRKKSEHSLKVMRKLHRSLTKDNPDLTSLKKSQAGNNLKKRVCFKREKPRKQVLKYFKNQKLQTNEENFNSSFYQNEAKSSIESALFDPEIQFSIKKRKKYQKIDKIREKINFSIVTSSDTKRREPVLNLPPNACNQKEGCYASQINIVTNDPVRKFSRPDFTWKDFSPTT
ncbi:unnamed protein product [Moneuplotes crassus]|uniref:Uncharacterized protein n=1 Tax=Euplotes crassus TaxID=5936 RepID=A0AAD1XY06_EUPCR|nr:unnamed protein product [Moneuplotes crassus]